MMFKGGLATFTQLVKAGKLFSKEKEYDNQREKSRGKMICCRGAYTYWGHSGEYGNGAKLVGKMSKSVMQLIAIHFLNCF